MCKWIDEGSRGKCPQAFSQSQESFALSQHPFALSQESFALSQESFALSQHPFALSLSKGFERPVLSRVEGLSPNGDSRTWCVIDQRG